MTINYNLTPSEVVYFFNLHSKTLYVDILVKATVILFFFFFVF